MGIGRPWFGTRGRRVAAALAALSVVVTLGSGASATTQSKLNRAKAELASLEATIRTQEQVAAKLQDQVAVLGDKVDRARTDAEAIGEELALTQDQLQATQQQYDSVQGQLDALARSAYIAGPGSEIEVILGAGSISDLNDRVQFVDQVSQQDAIIANQVADLAAELSSKQITQEQLLAKQSSLLQDLNQQQTAKDAVLQAQQAALDDLSATREHIVSLVVKLRAKLKAEELAALGNSFQGGAHTTYGNWAGLFLQTMGVPGCHSNKVVMVAWQVAEFTQAAWNPLATTYDMPGATPYNSVGVKNYVSLDQGLQASRLTIVNGAPSYLYGPIVTSLGKCASPMATARAINASSWCRGCVGGNYVTGVVPEVQADYATYAAL